MFTTDRFSIIHCCLTATWIQGTVCCAYFVCSVAQMVQILSFMGSRVYLSVQLRLLAFADSRH